MTNLIKNFVVYGIFLLQVRAQSSEHSYNSVDLTLVAGSSGVDVVDACIQKINNIPLVFGNDFGFLKRIALVESDFGKTLADANGGIWQITPQIHQQLLNATQDLDSVIQASASVIGAENVDLTNNNFSIPMRSAFAARLFLHLLVGNSTVPGTISTQAAFWATNNDVGGRRNQFVTIVQDYENANRCEINKLDLWFLIDESRSIRRNFRTVLQFVIQVSSQFTVSPDKVRLGLMAYSANTRLISTFNQHVTNEEFVRVVNSTVRTGGGTHTGEAIRETRLFGFNGTTGARPPSEGVPRILIVLTDGQSSDDVIVPSREIKTVGVTVFAVGVGTFNVTQINAIASDPDSEYAFEFKKFNKLSSILKNRLSAQTCSIPVVLPNETPIATTLTQGTPQYFSIQLLGGGEVQLQFESNSTSGMAFVSATVTNPNSAIFDAAVNLTEGITMLHIDAGGDGPFSNASTIYTTLITNGTAPLRVDITATGSQVRHIETGDVTTAPPMTEEVASKVTTAPPMTEEVTYDAGMTSTQSGEIENATDSMFAGGLATTGCGCQGIFNHVTIKLFCFVSFVASLSLFV